MANSVPVAAPGVDGWTSRSSGSDSSESDGATTTSADRSRNNPNIADVKPTEPDNDEDGQSHIVFGTGADKSGFDLTVDLDVASSSAVASSGARRAPPDDDDVTTVQLLQQPPGYGKLADGDADSEEAGVRRRIHIAWLIVFGSVTSIFCFPFGVVGLILAVFAWLYETAQLSSSIDCGRSASQDPMTPQRRRETADRCARVSLIVSLVGVAVGVVVAIVFIILGLVWTEDKQHH